MLPGCACPAGGACSADTCACAEKAAALWQGFLFHGDPPCLTPVVIARDAAAAGRPRPRFDPTVFECNDSCPCGLTCPNRVTQAVDAGTGASAALVPHLRVVDRGPVVGVGLATAVPLKCGQFVCRYVGDVVSVEEADRRAAAASAAGARNYILRCTEVGVAPALAAAAAPGRAPSRMMPV